VSGLRTGRVYAVYGIAVLLGVLVMAVAGASGAGLGYLAGSIFGGRQDSLAPIFVIGGFGIGYGCTIAIVMGFTRSRITNLVFNTARLERVAAFNSKVSATRLARLYLENLGIILITCGLLIPWAVIRVARYRVESLAVVVKGPLDQVTGASSSAADATGEELGEMFGFDLAL
jgi:uncharacterized membrane protein YjgN (DUF898 family)